ncbi:MAG: gliding motility-associated C-terminal domain-containing protein [Bacteroidales bacterium]|nr:gliding motility-associated C-terminal domain-containing protein [Bacteroidales bacterium]
MNKYLFLYFLSISLLLSGSLPGFSQIFAPDASKRIPTQYQSGFSRTDTIYVVCSSDDAGDPGTGTLIARPPTGITNTTFVWSKYNDTNHNYDPPFLAEKADESKVIDLTSGGYMVQITNESAFDETYYAWLFIDTPYVATQFQNFTCEYVALNGFIGTSIFTYFDPGDNSSINLDNDTKFEWSSDPYSSIPYPTLELNPVTYSPPYEDTWYYLTVTDSMACTDRASLLYESIVAKADFELDPKTGEAPLEVSFTNNSKNTVEYKWRFGNDSSSILESPEPHTYYIPGNYYVILEARSEAGCLDISDSVKVFVEPSSLDVPNVFTPNGDGYNDYFYVAAKSLRSIHVKIVNRDGRKIYDFEGKGNELGEWKGWDGKVGGSRYAAPGVYYYIIEALGWDDVEYASKIYRGAFHLIREK